MAPAQEIANQSKTGAATNIIQGLATGMASTWIPTVLIAIGIWACNGLGGMYGICIAAVGMLSTLGISLGVDAYGPVADNAGGLAEMTHQPPEVRKRTDSLDATGNTTAAIGKGFAIGQSRLGVARIHHCFPPFHLFHQEIGRHRGVVFRLNVVAGQMQQVFGPLQRLFQRLVGLVGMRRPLHRDPALGIAGMGEAIRMDLCLNVAIAGIEVRQIEPKATVQSEQGEVVGSEIHQTLNDSPQPHWSFTFGLLNLKPSFRPSRAKSSSIPSR